VAFKQAGNHKKKYCGQIGAFITLKCHRY